MNRLIIGTDVGTTASKVLIVDEQGSICRNPTGNTR